MPPEMHPGVISGHPGQWSDIGKVQSKAAELGVSISPAGFRTHAPPGAWGSQTRKRFGQPDELNARSGTLVKADFRRLGSTGRPAARSLCQGLPPGSQGV